MLSRSANISDLELNSVFDSGFFDKTEPVELVLQADFSSLLSKELGEPDKNTDAWLRVGSHLKGSLGTGAAVTLRSRGNSRKTCRSIPPLWIQFQTGKKLRLATQCYPSNDLRSEPSLMVLKEYVLYRAIELFGIPGFKTRLTKIEYLNLDQTQYGISYAFFIEPREEMAGRYRADFHNLDEIKSMNYFYGKQFLEKLSKRSQMNYGMIESIILDKDHGLGGTHDEIENNYGFLTRKRNGAPSEVVAYDFDRSDLINSSFMDPTLGPLPKKPREKTLEDTSLYMKIAFGFHSKMDDFKRYMAQRFLDKKPLIHQLLNSFDLGDDGLMRAHFDKIFSELEKLLKN